MARTARSIKLDTPSARAKLPHNKSGYWITLTPGRSFGYRKGPKGGKWVARFIIGKRRHETNIGIADDIMDANSQDILTFSQAQTKARDWFEALSRPNANGNSAAMTVKQCVENYLVDYKAGKTRGGGTGWRDTERTINAHILPELGSLKLADIDRGTIEQWRDRIASSPPRRRTKRGDPPNHAKAPMDSDLIRRRRSTTNRVLSTLKAILNHAHDHSGIGNKAAWSAVKSFRQVNAPKVRWLTDKEALKLSKVADTDIRDMIIAALLTGARYGELAALQIKNFSVAERSIYIEKSKSGKPRNIHLSDEGVGFFKTKMKDKAPTDFIFKRTNGAVWKHSDQYRSIKAACEAAEIKPAIGFHILRHTFASRLAMKGVPMAVIAAQLGHADTRITEKHYAHLGPSYVADTFRNAFGDFGFSKKKKSKTKK